MKKIDWRFSWLFLATVGFAAPFLESVRPLEEMAPLEKLVCSAGYLISASGFLGLLLLWLNNGFTQSAKVNKIAKGMIALGVVTWAATWLAGRLAWVIR